MLYELFAIEPVTPSKGMGRMFPNAVIAIRATGAEREWNRTRRTIL